MSWSKVPYKRAIKSYLRQVREHELRRFLPKFKKFGVNSITEPPPNGLLSPKFDLMAALKNAKQTIEASAARPSESDDSE